MTTIDANGQLDHLVYGVLDLQKAAGEIERSTGVRPGEGGRHLGRGSRNYLLAFSPTAYLEIIALDAENPADEGQPVPFQLDTLTSDRMVTWAIHPGDIDGALVKSRRHGADHGKLAPMSRTDNDGNVLEWTLAKSEDLPLDGLAPFLIDWGTSLHPAESGLPIAELTDLSITAPDPEAVNALYDDLGLGIRALQGDPAIRATIRGPKGEVTL